MILRCIAQARLKKKQWVDVFTPKVAIGPLDRLVAGHKELEGSHVIDEEAEEEEEEEPEYLVGFSMEHEAAWRVIAKGEKHKNRQYTTDIKVVETVEGPKACEATWPDGFSCIIEALDPEVFGSMKREVHVVEKRPSMLMKKPATAGELTTSDGKVIKVKFKKDRGEIYQVEVGGKAKCQIKRDIAEEPFAYECMQTIARKLSEGLVSEDGLYVLRNELIAEKGLEIPGKKKASTCQSPKPKRAKTQPTRERTPSPPPLLDHLMW